MKFNFAENKTVDKLETVPEDFRGLYVEKEGKFVLDTEDPKVKSAVSALLGINTALIASRAEAKAAQGRAVDLSSLAEYGETPTTIAETFVAKLAEVAKAGKGKGGEEKEAAVKAAQDAMGLKHAADLKGHADRNVALTTQLHTVLVTGEATNALAAAKACDVDLVMPHVINQVKVAEAEGKFTVSVVNPDGTPRYSGTTGAPMAIKELVEDMRGTDKYKSLFQSDNTTGGGTAPTNRAAGGMASGGKKSSTQKIAAGLAAGLHKDN